MEVGHTVVGRLEPEKAGCFGGNLLIVRLKIDTTEYKHQPEPRHAYWISYWMLLNCVSLVKNHDPNDSMLPRLV